MNQSANAPKVFRYHPAIFPGATRMACWCVPLGLLSLSERWWNSSFDSTVTVPLEQAKTIADIAPYMIDSLSIFVGIPMVALPLWMMMMNRLEPVVRRRAQEHARRKGYEFVVVNPVEL